MQGYSHHLEHDFNLIATLETPRWSHNIHYYPFILSSLPDNRANVLEVGCGRGGLCRMLARHFDSVVGIDLSRRMIETAENLNSTRLDRTRFLHMNYLEKSLGHNAFSCIVSVATLHHMDIRAFAEKVRAELAPGGRLILVDLYQKTGLLQKLEGVLAIPISNLMRLYFNGTCFESRLARAYWRAHGETDVYSPISALKTELACAFPGGTLVRRFFWRYTFVWDKPV